ncbi:hypothetical protein [Fodinibius salsisoli]|uniref:Uncharacterized protein n=1 Tax=Fodinibius salsisoli TaxID=2820877 RepID=A0ABT3PP06_9BACT|nr:hypothetical protein [Fodinibius salsisoli]MCW9707592.1 hypothetical protein [Fodinibius salsisoli]
MYRLALIGSALTILLASCSPRPVFRMHPQAEQTSFEQGTEYVQIERNGVILTMSYYRHLSDQFVMDVEVVNETDSLLRVDPTQFSYDALKYISQDTSNLPLISSRRAINPELQLLEKDLQIAQTEANQRTGDLLHAIGQTASIVNYATADSQEEREDISQRSEEASINHEINRQRRAFYKSGLRDQREVWEIDALRKTDLFPGEYVRGYLFFKNEPDARAYIFYFDSAQALIELRYLQKRYKKKEGDIILY